jgi:HEAT repeat protein
MLEDSMKLMRRPSPRPSPKSDRRDCAKAGCGRLRERERTVCTLLMVILFIGLVAPSRAVEPATKPAATAAEGELSWHHTLKDAYAEALKQKRPILLVLGADWCQPCKVLEKEMATPEAAKALGRWTRVHLDVDHSEGAAAMLQSGAIPLLRVLSPTGRRVDFKEGTMPAADLAKWLDGAYEGAVAASGEELLGTDAPDAAGLAKLIERLADADAAMREAAIKRLAPHSAAAAVAVTDAFAKGNLLTRLSCLDLLAEWKAPLTDIDPWQPETLTPQRLKQLQDWAAGATKTTPATQPATKPAVLAPPQLEEARREIARMLAAPTQDEARALRERLARLGKALLPEVHARLAETLAESARERLLALRYRLAASDTLAIGWPAGLERLASADAQTRHGAAEELVGRATPDDGPLLLELFADSDSLVREISLRGLQAVWKGDAGRALVALLNDPDLNVRAAVLKQLAAEPSAAMLTAVIEFAQKEPDPDLVVHAVRVLRESKADRAIDGLLGVLGHANWRVRAEAAEALTEMTSERGNGNATPDRKAQVNVAMVKLLEDPDGFVVSRAVLALLGADVATAMDAMAKAAEAHPELAGEVIKGMSQSTKSRFAAEKHLRAFCFHKDDKVRSQAIAALCAITGDVEKEMKALLKDESEGVRMWAAASLFSMINSWRPNGRPGTHTEGGFFGFGAKTVEDKNDPAQWATDFRAGKGRPNTWLADLLPDLETLTSAKGAETRLDGALPLLALGPPEKALEVVRAAVQAEPRLGEKAAGALPWLGTEQRIELFKQIAGIGGQSAGRHGGLSTLANAMAIVRDPKAAPSLWGLLDESAGIDRAEVVLQALQQLYFGERNYSNEPAADNVRTQAVADAKGQLAAGTEMQRLVALAMLLSSSPADAVEGATKVFEDMTAPDELRADALQVRLLAGRKADGVKAATAALALPQRAFRSVAIKFLATGGQELNRLRGAMYVSFNNPELNRNTYVTQNTPVILDAPAGVTVEMLKPLLADTDRETAAYAGYLLALMGDRSGIEALLGYWRANPRAQHVPRLVYRAAAALKADDMVPVLEQLYAGYEKQNYYVREFYWTIRLIGGEGALKLRKRIRDEVGMQQLR